MGLQISDLRKDARTIDVPVYVGEQEEATIKVTYRPSAITPNFTKMLDAREEGVWSVGYVVGAVTAWDLMDGEVMLPITEETVGAVPNYVIINIMRAISDDMGKARLLSNDS